MVSLELGAAFGDECEDVFGGAGSLVKAEDFLDGEVENVLGLFQHLIGGQARADFQEKAANQAEDARAGEAQVLAVADALAGLLEDERLPRLEDGVKAVGFLRGSIGGHVGFNSRIGALGGHGEDGGEEVLRVIAVGFAFQF